MLTQVKTNKTKEYSNETKMNGLASGRVIFRTVFFNFESKKEGKNSSKVRKMKKRIIRAN